MAPRLYDHILAICRDNGFLPSAIRHARNPNFVHGLVLAGRGVHLNQQTEQRTDRRPDLAPRRRTPA